MFDITFTNEPLSSALGANARLASELYQHSGLAPDYVRPRSMLLDDFHPKSVNLSISRSEWERSRRTLLQIVPDSFGAQLISKPTENEAENEPKNIASGGSVEVHAAGYSLAGRLNALKADFERRVGRLNSPATYEEAHLYDFVVLSHSAITQYRKLVESPIVSGCLLPIQDRNSGDEIARLTIRCEIENVFDLGLNLMLLGGAGSGKTTALQVYAHRKLRDGSRRVLYLQLARLLPHLKSISRSECANDVETLSKAIEEYLKLTGSEASSARVWSTTDVVILDGIDEVASEVAWLVNAIAELAQTNPQLQVITSCRTPSTHIERLPFVGICVRPFAQEQIERFVKAWYGPDARRKADELLQRIKYTPSLCSIVESPFLLTILCILQDQRGSVPLTLTELLDERIELLLGRYDRAKRITRLRTESSILRSVARKLAFALHSLKRREGTLEELIAIARKRVGSAAHAEVAVRELIEHCNVLVPTSFAGSYSFGHLLFQEHLAASELVANTSIELKNQDRAWWSGVERIARQMVRPDEEGRLSKRLINGGMAQLPVEDPASAENSVKPLGLETLKGTIREVWGNNSDAEVFLDVLIQYIEKHPKDEFSLGELRSFVSRLKPTSVDKLAFWFAASKQAIFAVNFRFRREDGSEFPVHPLDLSIALESGFLFDAERSVLVHGFLSNTFPHFMVLDRLRRFASVDVEPEVGVE